MKPTINWKQLSDRDRAAAVAEHVMWWKTDGEPYWWSNGKRRVYLKDEYKPHLEYKGCGMVIETVAKKYPDNVTMMEIEGKWQVIINDQDATAPTLHEAVCIAALRAAGCVVNV